MATSTDATCYDDDHEDRHELINDGRYDHDHEEDEEEVNSMMMREEEEEEAEEEDEDEGGRSGKERHAHCPTLPHPSHNLHYTLPGLACPSWRA